MSKIELQKETATQNEPQFKTKKEIINDIIKILTNNNLTITNSIDILYETSKVICKQPVVIIDDHTGHLGSRVCAETPRFSTER